MHVFFLTSFTVFLVTFSSLPSALVDAGLAPIKKEVNQLEAVAEERARLLAEFLKDGVPAGDAKQESESSAPDSGLRQGGLRASGLHSGGLVTKAVQPASGLQSGAAGLTPESEWRKRFPRKPGQ